MLSQDERLDPDFFVTEEIEGLLSAKFGRKPPLQDAAYGRLETGLRHRHITVRHTKRIEISGTCWIVAHGLMAVSQLLEQSRFECLRTRTAHEY